MGILPNVPFGRSFVNKLPKILLGDSRREFASALGRAVRPMSLLDVTNRPLADDHPPWRPDDRIDPILGLRTPDDGENHPKGDPPSPYKCPPQPEKSRIVHLSTEFLDGQSGILSSKNTGARNHYIGP